MAGLEDTIISTAMLTIIAAIILFLSIAARNELIRQRFSKVSVKPYLG